MDRPRRPSEADAELLLVGQAPRDDTSLAPVLGFVESVRGALVDPTAEEVAAGHLRAMADVVQGRPAAAPRRQRPWPLVRPPRLASAAAAALVLCLTLASFGALPGPVQARLADASRAVGIPLPRPEPAIEDHQPPSKPQPQPRASGATPAAPVTEQPAPGTAGVTAPDTSQEWGDCTVDEMAIQCDGDPAGPAAGEADEPPTEAPPAPMVDDPAQPSSGSSGESASPAGTDGDSVPAGEAPTTEAGP